MALSDEQEAVLNAQLEALKKELTELKALKKEEKEVADENAGKKLPEESPEKAKINADYAKSIQDLINRIQALEKRLGEPATDNGLRPILWVD